MATTSIELEQTVYLLADNPDLGRNCPEIGKGLKRHEHRRQETLERWEAYEQTGDAIDHERVAEWLESWGSDQEKPCPTVK